MDMEDVSDSCEFRSHYQNTGMWLLNQVFIVAVFVILA